MATDTASNLWTIHFQKIAKFNGTSWTEYDTSVTRSKAFKRCISIDQSNNNVWIGTGNGLLLYNGSSWISYNTANSGILNDTAYSIFAKNGLVYAGFRTGISVFDGSAWTNFTSTGTSFPLVNIYTIAVQNNGAVWAGSDSGRIAYYYKGNWKLYDTLDGIANAPIRSIVLGKDERLWFSAPYRIQKYDGRVQSQQNHIYTLENGKALGANDYLNNCAQIVRQWGSLAFPIVSDNNGNIWAGKDGHLFELSHAATKEYSYVADSDYIEFYSPATRYIAAAKNGLIYAVLKSDKTNGLYSFDKTRYNHKTGAPWEFEPQFKDLDINKVKAKITNRGDMFWDFMNSPKYEVPKGECKNAIFANALWIGGYSNQNLHVAAMTYRQSGSDFYPGALDTTTASCDTARSNQWDKIWKVNRTDIEKFKQMYASGLVNNGSYKIPADIMNWPAHGNASYNEAKYLAPFVDVNSDGFYNPMQGDYPDIKGDQALFYIFNDHTNLHTETAGRPLGIEVHAMAYAYNCDSIAENDSSQALNYTTFYRYKIINRSQHTYDSTRVGIWTSNELGNYDDDYAGCNPKENMAFVYNSDNYDETPFGYGENPPMLSYLLLDGHPAENDGKDNDNDGIIDEAGEKMLLNKFLVYNNDFTYSGNPSEAVHYYYYLGGRWKNNKQVTYGNRGTDISSAPADFMYPDNPYDTSAGKWNENTAQPKYGMQRTFVMSSGGFTLAPGEETVLEYAIVYSRDEKAPNGRNTSLKKNYQYTHAIRNFYNNQSFPSCANASSAIKPALTNLQLSIYPNPASTSVYINYKTSNINCFYQLIDAQGRTIQNGKFMNGSEISIANVKPGLYFLQLNDNGKILRGTVNKL